MSYQLTTLSSGSRVASEWLPGVETVAVSVSVSVGARHETEAERGLSHLLEHMAFKGTARRSARDIAEQFDAIGGQFNAYTSMENTVYYAKVLKGDLPLAVDILGDILLHSAFEPSELTREQGVVLQEIAMHRDTPDDYIFDLFDEVAFPDQPMGRSILGPAAQVSSYTREHLIAYMRRHYTPQRMVVTAAGNLSHDALVALVAAHMGIPAAVPDAAPLAVEPARYRGGDTRHEEDLEQLHLLLGFPSVSAHDDAYYAVGLYSAILGGGMSSRLFQEVREKRGMAYHVGSMVSAYDDCGMLSIYSATGPEHRVALPTLLMEEVQRMVDGVTDAELSRVRNQQRAELWMARENPGSVAGWVGKHLLRFGRYRPLEEIVARIDAVTKDDIHDVAERVAATPVPTFASLGPQR